MPIEEDVAETFVDISAVCERVEQQTSFYCGAACCKMILDVYGIAATQAEAYSLIHDDTRFATEELYSDPIGVAKCLNEKTPNHIAFDVKEYSSGDKQKVVDRIYYTIHFLKVPCMVLVQKGNHWVVIDTVRLRDRPDGTREVMGVFIDNPWYNSSPNKYVPINEFLNGWLTPVQWGRTWRDRLIIMSDGASGDIASITLGAPKTAPARLWARIMTAGYKEADLQGSAISSLAGHGISKVRKIRGGGAAVVSPITVRDLSGDASFVIVPLDASESVEFGDFIYAAIRQDTGELLEVARFGRVLQIYSHDEAVKELATIAPGATVQVSPEYVWMRSYQTMSRFQVAREVTVNGAGAYLLSDGTLTQTLVSSSIAGG